MICAILGMCPEKKSKMNVLYKLSNDDLFRDNIAYLTDWKRTGDRMYIINMPHMWKLDEYQKKSLNTWRILKAMFCILIIENVKT